ncbi:MAG: hypothetical protein KQJ78_00200 [Deltaproteobacteria bacterium]|nr:hypothetical protein [Deltaproteobacteria bacterium]
MAALRPKVVFHISGHGYGHAVRAVQVMAELPPAVELEVACPLPAAFFQWSLVRPFRYLPLALDVGCRMAGPLGVDLAATRRAVEQLLADRKRLVESEAARLAGGGAGVVVADSGFLPLVAARRAGLAAVLLASFTWREIYAGLAAAEPGLAACLPQVAEAYQALDLHLRPPLSMDFAFDGRTREVELIAPAGRDLGPSFRRGLGLGPGEKLALVYLGVYGGDRLPAWRVPPGWRLVGLEHQLDLPGYQKLDPGEFPHADVTASVDLVVGKLGYSLLATCLATGTPILFEERPAWPENPALEAAARAWGGAWGVAPGRLWSQEPEVWAAAAARRQAPRPRGGARQAAAILADLAAGGRGRA